jgi:hypothetical protein
VWGAKEFNKARWAISSIQRYVIKEVISGPREPSFGDEAARPQVVACADMRPACANVYHENIGGRIGYFLLIALDKIYDSFDEFLGVSVERHE